MTRKARQRKRRRPAVIRALALWHDTPGKWVHDWSGEASYYVRFGASFTYVDEQFRVHSHPLKEGQRLPRFKIVELKHGLAIKLGERAGEFSIVRKGQ